MPFPSAFGHGIVLDRHRSRSRKECDGRGGWSWLRPGRRSRAWGGRDRWQCSRGFENAGAWREGRKDSRASARYFLRVIVPSRRTFSWKPSKSGSTTGSGRKVGITLPDQPESRSAWWWVNGSRGELVVARTSMWNCSNKARGRNSGCASFSCIAS